MSASDKIRGELLLALSALAQLSESALEPAEAAAARDGLIGALDELAQLVHENPAAILPDVEVTGYGRLTIYRVAIAEPVKNRRPRCQNGRRKASRE